MNYARIVDGIVFEVIVVPDGSRIEEMLPPDAVATCVPCDAAVDQMWRYEEGVFLPPAPPVPPTQEQLATSVRRERDRRITATDYLMAMDYPVTDEEREPWRVYRQELRDIPEQEGFPWAGGGMDDADCPWPQMPGVSETGTTK